MGGEDPLEKKMATNSSILAWKIPWTEEPGGLQSMGSQVRHHLSIKQQKEAYSIWEAFFKKKKIKIWVKN